jgi:pimeloyl-ACP methyl ester carboxylesterase
VPVPGGHLPGWRFTPRDPEPTGTWLIGVHGRGAGRAELFRLVHAALDAGVTCLVASYRTDRWTAHPSAMTTLGQTEWEDLESTVRVALAAGAQRIVLAGCSLGGSIAATFLRRSRLAKVVAGVILDSPALDWPPILEHVAHAARIPRAILPGVMLAARWRAHIDWHALDHVAAADDFVHPILLIHGADDTVVPVWLSDAFAAARPDLVTYVRVDGAGHVRSWNHAPERYEARVHAALAAAARSAGVAERGAHGAAAAVPPRVPTTVGTPGSAAVSVELPEYRE